MTDPVDPVDPLDLEASSALDDAAGDPRPELARRMEAFGRVRAAVAAPVDPPPAEAREAAVAAALGAFDAQGADARDPVGPGVSVVTPLRRPRPTGRWLGAAAAAAVLVLGAAAVLNGGFGGTDRDETAATATADETTADEATADEATELDAVGDDADASAPVAAPSLEDAQAGTTFGGADGSGGTVELGAHDDLEALVRSLRGPVEEAQRTSLPTTTTARNLDAGSAAGAGDDEDACAETRSAVGDEGQIVLEGDALVAGAPVRVLVVDPGGTSDAGAPGTRLEVVLADPGGVGCPVLERVPLGS